MEMLIVEVSMFLLSGLFVMLWWFYRQRDQDRKEDISGISARIKAAEDLITDIRLTYTKENDFKEFSQKIFEKLEVITNLLHTKADRQERQ